MAKPTGYIETTVISYYTPRPSRDVVIAGHQAVTVQWWEQDLPKFDAIISQVVEEEIATGDAEAASRRLAVVSAMPILQVTPETEALAEEYFKRILLPQTARADAYHLALATMNGIEYLVTWNCRHIASARVRGIVRALNEKKGYETPLICTPEELLEY